MNSNSTVDNSNNNHLYNYNNYYGLQRIEYDKIQNAKHISSMENLNSDTLRNLQIYDGEMKYNHTMIVIDAQTNNYYYLEANNNRDNAYMKKIITLKTR